MIALAYKPHTLIDKLKQAKKNAEGHHQSSFLEFSTLLDIVLNESCEQIILPLETVKLINGWYNSTHIWERRS